MTERQILQLTLLAAETVSQAQEHGEHNQHGRHNPQATELRVNVVFQQQTQNADGQGANNNQPTHAGIRIVTRHAAHKSTKPRLHNAHNIAPEENQNRGLSAQLGDRGERGTRVGLLRQDLANNVQMRR